MAKFVAVLAEGVGFGASEAEMGVAVEGVQGILDQLLQEATNPTPTTLKPLLMAHVMASQWMFRTGWSLVTSEDEKPFFAFKVKRVQNSPQNII